MPPAGPMVQQTIAWTALALGLLALTTLFLARFDDDPLNLRDPESPSVATLLDIIGDPRIGPYDARVLSGSPEAADALAADGIECEVIDGRSVRPLDMATITRSVAKTSYCVVVDQSWPFASVGAEVAAQVHEHCFDDLDNHVARVHSDDVPAPYAYNLEQEMLPNTRKITEAVRSITYIA